MKNEKEVLLGLYKKSKDVLESKRVRAVLLVKEGKTISEVAKFFYVDEDTVRNWVTKWGGENEVKKKLKKKLFFSSRKINPTNMK